jgi:hypothetical protein
MQGNVENTGTKIEPDYFYGKRSITKRTEIDF